MKDVQETLERLVPEPARMSNWDAVLRDSRPRGRSSGLQLAVATGVIAMAALFVVAPWKGSERVGILDRALAAVGDGPVTHLVFRDEWGGALVDLKTGERQPLYSERELWLDPERGMAGLSRFGGTVQSRYVSPPKDIQKPLAILAGGYREALEEGRAHLAGEGVVDGVPIYWIQVHREVLRDVGDGKDHVWAQEVAVSRDTYKPVYVRSARDGKMEEASGARVLVAEQLPAGSGDFTPQPRDPLERAQSFGVSPDSIPRTEAQAILGGKAAWVGQSFEGLQLAKIGKLTMMSGYSSATGKWADKLTGVTLIYGAVNEQGDPVGPKVIWISQAPRRHVTLERGAGGFDIPEGHVLLMYRGHAFLNYEGTFVVINAILGKQSEEQALAIARALRPLSVGSGAGE